MLFWYLLQLCCKDKFEPLSRHCPFVASVGRRRRRRSRKKKSDGWWFCKKWWITCWCFLRTNTPFSFAQTLSHEHILFFYDSLSFSMFHSLFLRFSVFFYASFSFSMLLSLFLRFFIVFCVSLSFSRFFLFVTRSTTISLHKLCDMNTYSFSMILYRFLRFIVIRYTTISSCDKRYENLPHSIRHMYSNYSIFS